jgi:large subunit ribosomal protein LX
MVKIFEVRGKFQMGEEVRPFVKEVAALKKDHALEKVYSELGSKHRTPRNKIKIIEVKEKEE